MPMTPRGLDGATQGFPLHGVENPGNVVLTTRLARAKVLAWIAPFPPGLLGLEASGGPHDWAREVPTLGHPVKRMRPQFVRPARGSNMTPLMPRALATPSAGRRGGWSPSRRWRPRRCQPAAAFARASARAGPRGSINSEAYERRTGSSSRPGAPTGGRPSRCCWRRLNTAEPGRRARGDRRWPRTCTRGAPGARRPRLSFSGDVSPAPPATGEPSGTGWVR